MPILFRPVDAATREPHGRAAGGTTINASPGGLLFQSDTPVNVGQEVEMALPLSGVDRVTTIAVVTRVRAAEDSHSIDSDQAVPTEMAVRFVRITGVDQERIVRYVLMTLHRRQEAARHQPPAPVAAQAAPRPAAQADPPAPKTLAQKLAEARPAAPIVPRPAPAPNLTILQRIDSNQPLIAVGLGLCEGGKIQDVHHWFDSLVPGARIELLSQLQTNMAGGVVPGANEPGSVRPLALALGLLAA